MDFVFPVFVRASNDTTPPAPPQKSLWQLVMESAGDDTLPEHMMPQRMTTRRVEGGDNERDADNAWREKGNDVAATYTADTNNTITNTNDGVSSRSSWKPVTYMVEHLLPSGFVSQFAVLQGIECSARLPPPPCLRLQDLQLPPVVLKRLQRQLPLFRVLKRSMSGAVRSSRRRDLRELQAIVFGSGVVTSCDEKSLEDNADENIKGGAYGCSEHILLDKMVLTALQQFTVTSMLLGYHTISVGPKGVGKRTIGFLATGALTLARKTQQLSNDKESDHDHQANTSMMQTRVDTQIMRPRGPQAMIIVSSYDEVHACSRWMQSVFTAGAFTLLTFGYGTTELVPLPVLHEEPCSVPNSFQDEALRQSSILQPPPPPPILPAHTVVAAEEEEETRHSHDLCDRRQEERIVQKRGRDSSRSQHGRHNYSSDTYEREKRRRHHSLSHYRSRSRRRRRRCSRSLSRSRRHYSHRYDRRRRSSRSQRRYRHRSSKDDKRKRKKKREDSRDHRGRRHYDQSDHHHHEERFSELPHCSQTSVKEQTNETGNFSDMREMFPPTVTHYPSVEAVHNEEIPCCLQQSVPILITAQSSLIEALQAVQGQAELLPLETVRLVCISDADHMAQPTLHASVPASWWVSFSNAVDVDCQYIVSASRMYDEVDGWLRETLLRETPDVVNRYRQRDDTVWCGVQHFVETVFVDEAEESVAQRMFERVEAAKIRRVIDIVTQHFSLLHITNVQHSTVAYKFDTTSTSNDSNNNTDGAALLTPPVGGLVVVVASRKEQEFVFHELSSGLRNHAAHVRCTCHLSEFQQGDGDVWVTYDWMLSLSSFDIGVSNRPVDKVINFGFPRTLMAPGKEESLLECLVIRVRALLHCKVMDTNMEEKEEEGCDMFVAVDTDTTKIQSTVVTLLTERQMNGRIGRLLSSRAQALTSY